MRAVTTSHTQTLELISTGEVSIAMLRDRLKGCTRQTHAKRLSFLESSLRGSSNTPQRLGDDRSGRQTLSKRDSRKGGCAASRSMPLKKPLREKDIRTDNDCSGNGFGGMLAHRVVIQAPQPKLHNWLVMRHNGSPPLLGLTPEQQTLTRT